MTISFSCVHVKKTPLFWGLKKKPLSLDFPSFGRSLVTPYGRCVERCLARIKGGKNQQKSVRSDEFLIDVFFKMFCLSLHPYLNHTTLQFDDIILGKKLGTVH